MLKTPERDKHIVNVSAVEGQFYRTFKTDAAPAHQHGQGGAEHDDAHGRHRLPHDGIHMNSVDTGWVTDEDPVEIAARKTADHRFHPPLDAIDGAARILDPIIAASTRARTCGAVPEGLPRHGLVGDGFDRRSRAQRGADPRRHAGRPAVRRGRHSIAWEIVVVDDASTDATARIAADAGARVVPVQVRQIAAARNAGARRRAATCWCSSMPTPSFERHAWRRRGALRAGAPAAGATSDSTALCRCTRGPAWPPRSACCGSPRWRRLLRVLYAADVRRHRRLRRAPVRRRGDVPSAVAVKRVGRMVLVRPPVVTSARKFRTHSARELTRMTMAALHLGRRMRSREHLHLWYGDRRHDPEGTVVRRRR
jgi:hypothetical protein